MPFPDTAASAVRAVFLSYARQDAEPARRIAEALRGFGIEVWFDQEELRGGDSWDAKIKQQIRECVLFVAIISGTTQSRGEGYFRREWKLAVERTYDMAASRAFLVPVVIDDTPETRAEVPEEFMRVQWTRLPGGVPTTQFVERIKTLLDPRGVPTNDPVPPRPATAFVPPAAHPRRFNGKSALRAIGVVAVTAVLGILLWRSLHPAEPADRATPSSVAAATSVAASPAATPAVPLPAEKSIAVLPFANMSDDKDSGFFADGVHEDILTHLALIPDLKVISRTTVTQYRDTKKSLRQIGQELGVAYILEGSVRRAGNKVRVTGQLINARTDEHVWAKAYDRDLTDIFAIQAALATEIAGALSAALSPETREFIARRPTDNPRAYDAYLKGRDLRNRAPGGAVAPMVQAEQAFEEAVRLDPNFSAAWGELAVVHALWVFWQYDQTPQRLARGDAAIGNAVRLAPDSPDVMQELGTYAYYAYRDYGRALAEYRKLAQLRPNDPSVVFSIGLIQRRQGNWAESLPNLEKAAELDPGSVVYQRGIVESCQQLRRWEQVFAAQRRVVALQPDSLRDQHFLAQLIYQATGSAAEWQALLQRLTPQQRESPRMRAYRKFWDGVLGDFAEFKRLDEAQPFFDEDGAEHYSQAFNAAVVYAAHGEPQRARARIAGFPEELSARIEREPNNTRLLSTLGGMEALLGHTDRAIDLAHRTVRSLPEATDAIDGPATLGSAAEIFALARRKDEAIAALTHLMRVPSSWTIRRIQMDDAFASLRDDERYRALMNDPKNNQPLL